MARVLIVDDSATSRELIEEILGSDPDLEVIGCAANGREAVALTKQLQPDVLTMDIYMPELDGLESTREIMASFPTPIVIVSASTLVNDVEWGMKAIEAGALTMLLKPPGPRSPNYSAAVNELTSTVKAMAGMKVFRKRQRSNRKTRTRETPKLNVTHGPHVIAIAASTGGPPAVQKILLELPCDFAAPILLVQHIASGFTDGLVGWLDANVSLKVKTACDDETLKGGVVYVAPEDRHLGLKKNGRILLSETPPIDGFRPSASFLFESVGNVQKKAGIGVILTGMGSDGVQGLATLRVQGGYVIAQDEDSSVVYGMPNAAKQAGVVDVTLPIDQIGRAIVRAM